MSPSRAPTTPCSRNPERPVQVYEINLAKYFLVTQREVDASVALEGLGPSYADVLPVAAPRLALRRCTVTAPGFAGRRGCFVVDVSGGGFACRAVVRKGKLAVIERPTARGVALSIVYEDGSVPSAPAALLDGRRYAVRGQCGDIYVPWAAVSAHGGSVTVIVTDGHGFAQRVDLCPRDEEYELRGALHVERETLVAHSKAPVTVRYVAAVLVAAHGPKFVNCWALVHGGGVVGEGGRGVPTYVDLQTQPSRNRVRSTLSQTAPPYGLQKRLYQSKLNIALWYLDA